ncbi:MAG TPA: homocysteine S-methyltransferase family protein [Bacteroidota bacterium]|nr:homocysteine S-methyltransferase family protein [Bacteroidota bacterium]
MSSTPLIDLLKTKRPRILDGAMGTELERRGVDIGLPLWSANALMHAPDVVVQIHKDYIAAGADIITTNTFRTNRRVFARAGLPDRSEELTRRAVELAVLARQSFPERRVLIAGSIAPVEDCYRPDLVPSDQELQEEHAEHAARLARFGVDLLLIETMTTIREAYAAAAAARATGKEVIVSFTCRRDGTLYGGEPLGDAVKALAELQPAMFSLNCISPRYLTPLIEHMNSVLASIQPRPPFAVYANVGKPDVREGKMVRDVNEDEYLAFAKEWKALGAFVIGGCCGTTPEYIRLLKQNL